MKDSDLMLAAALFRDHAAHEAQRLDGRVIFGLNVGGAEFARKRTRRGHCRKQRCNDYRCPRKAGAVHRQRLPF
jgi:hypothetical protein